MTALASGRTPLRYREYFYRHNAIPGAIWRGNPDAFGDPNDDGVRAVIPHDQRFPILANPDAIMPANYSITHVRQDIAAVQDIVEAIGSFQNTLPNVTLTTKPEGIRLNSFVTTLKIYAVWTYHR